MASIKLSDIKINNGSGFADITVDKLGLDCYPIGSVYMSINDTSPASLFGGTWTQVTKKYIRASTVPGSTGGKDSYKWILGYDWLSYYGLPIGFGFSAPSGPEVRPIGLPTWDANGTYTGYTAYDVTQLESINTIVNSSVSQGTKTVNGVSHLQMRTQVSVPLTPPYQGVAFWYRTA